MVKGEGRVRVTRKIGCAGAALLLALLLSVFLALRSYRLTPHVLHVPLMARCELELYEPYDAQPVFTIVLACPRTDAIRLWPLPITQPWAEDWFEPGRDGEEAGIPNRDNTIFIVHN